MPTIRHLFLEPPVVGRAYQLGGRSYDVTESAPYTRRNDGVDTDLFTWRTTCEDCDTAFTFKTGATAGDIQTRCRDCRGEWWREADARRKQVTADERTVRNPVEALEVYRAVQAAQRDTPRQMSLAPNATRRIFAPAILREAHEPLAEHTYAEILAGLDAALRQRLIHWATVGRYRSGNVRRGLLAHPEALLKAQGVWPSPAADFFA